MPPLNWKNLLENKCPKCKKALWFNKAEEMLICTYKCGFMIHQKKMESICIDITLGKLEHQGSFDTA